MRKTKLSFDLFARQHCNDGLFARFYRHPGSAILLQKQVSKASIAPRLSGHAAHYLPLYQDKAVTPTSLKDIFTPIWSEPLGLLLLCAGTLMIKIQAPPFLIVMPFVFALPCFVASVSARGRR
jgi:hypothetical protein